MTTRPGNPYGMGTAELWNRPLGELPTSHGRLVDPAIPGLALV